MRTRSVVFIACLVAPLTAIAGNVDNEYTRIARSAGPVRTVALQGDFAFVGVGHQLWVFDVSQTDPALAFESEALPYPVEAIAIRDRYAFVVAGRAGLFIYDIATPSSPSLVASFDTPGVAVDVAANGLDVLVAAQGAGLRRIHYTDLNALYEHVPANNDEFVAGVATEGSRVAETFNSPSGVVSFISVHVAPQKIRAYIPVHGTPRGLAVHSDLAYIAAGRAGLRIVDVSHVTIPPHSQEIGFSKKQGPEDAFDVALAGDLAFVADRTVSDGDELYRRGGLRIVDISDPAAPNQLGNLPGDVWSVAVDGARAVVADYTRGRTRNTSSLDIVDVANPAQPSRIASFSVPPEIKTPMATNGTDLYTVDTHLRRFDLSDPGRPHYAWGLALPRDTYFRGTLPGLAVDASHAYVGGGSAGLHVVDTSNPDEPHLVTTVDVEAYDVAVDGNRVYVSELFGGLSIVDVADPASPDVVGTISGNFSVGDIKIAGDVLYVAPYPGASLIIYDVSNPAAPMLLGYYSTGETTHHIEVSGSHLFLAIGDAGERIEVADVSDPSAPKFVSDFQGAYPTIGDMTLAGNSLYFTVPTVPGGGLRVLDVSRPKHLRRQGNYKMRTEFAHAAAVLPGGVVAIGGSAGLLVLQESTATRR